VPALGRHGAALGSHTNRFHRFGTWAHQRWWESAVRAAQADRTALRMRGARCLHRTRPPITHTSWTVLHAVVQHASLL